MNTSPSQVNRLDWIQALRGVAAIAVVLGHISIFGNGAWGVDLFFVISGFIMCYVTESSGKKFLTKRIIRIVPLYWAGTICIFFVALKAPSLLNNTTANTSELFKSLFFIPFKKGQIVQPLLFLGWTLNCEFFFYLVFAGFMAVSHKWRAILTSLVIFLIVCMGKLINFKWTPIIFFTNPIMLEFIYGMMIYILFEKYYLTRIKINSIHYKIGLTLIGVTILSSMPFLAIMITISNRPFVWGIPAALAFGAFHVGLTDIKLPWPVVLIGDASFSLYLFHPYILGIFNKFVHPMNGHNLQTYLMAGAALLLCCGVSLVSYEFIEKRLTNYLRKKFV